MTFAYADNIDTDGIIAGKYTKSLDAHEWPKHVFEDLDPEFKNKVQTGDIVVAGWNFGCGSSREQAPVAIKLAGVFVVIARTFVRIFFRNATNIGLPLLEIRDHDIDSGDELDIDLKMGRVFNKTKQKNYQAEAMPQVMIDILAEGGLVPYLKKYGNYQI
jgi:3-isopropylmalate dehydratase small subunit